VPSRTNFSKFSIARGAYSAMFWAILTCSSFGVAPRPAWL
jgi:hypothetical protein